jgi:hypothetical protein
MARRSNSPLPQMSYNPFAQPNAQATTSPWQLSAPLNAGSWVRPSSRKPPFAQPVHPFDRPGQAHPFDRPGQAHPFDRPGAMHADRTGGRGTSTNRPFDRPGPAHPFDRAFTGGSSPPRGRDDAVGAQPRTYEPFARPELSHPFDRTKVSRAVHMKAFGEGPKHTSAHFHGHFATGVHDRVCSAPRVFQATYPLSSAPSQYEAPGAPRVRGGSVLYF